MELKLIAFILFLNVLVKVNCSVQWDISTQNAFDLNLYEEVLDAELCEEQLQYIVMNNTELRMRMLDAGIRFPKGVFYFNFADMGNYYQCLEIKEELETEVPSVVEGKYCTINVPVFQDLELPELPTFPNITFPNITWPEGWPEITFPDMNSLRNNDKWRQNARNVNSLRSAVNTLIGSNDGTSDLGLGDIELSLAVCIPKVCTTQQAINYLYFNTSLVSLDHTVDYCRLPNDKQWVAADYVASVIFSIIGLLTIICTLYDVRHTFILKKDPKTANSVYQIFSIYTNSQRLLKFPSNPNALTCLDGIRSLAMMWVIIGHTFSSQLSGKMANPLPALSWTESAASLWVTSALITVDTFFMISGLLIVYTTVGKFSSMKLVKNIHLFYLNRLLRMFPMLATAVLLQASFFNRVADGPFWAPEAYKVHKCRTYWWSTLLHIQNYVNPDDMCLLHTWYLAVDVQLHIISPIVLFWVLKGRKPLAWGAMIIALLASLTGAATYIFYNNFTSGNLALSRTQEEREQYMRNYYFNTLTRCSPFFVGMLAGYILHLWRGKKIYIPKAQVALLWTCATVIAVICIYIHYPVNTSDWDNQIIDNLVNTFQRPAWAMSIAWMVIACHHGYGGPINWILSLSMWKLPARLSYAMYIFHYPLMFLVSATSLAPVYFSVPFSVFRFFADLMLAWLVAIVATVLIDSPFSSIIKIVLGGRAGPRKPKPVTTESRDHFDKERKNGDLNIAYISDDELKSKL